MNTATDSAIRHLSLALFLGGWLFCPVEFPETQWSLLAEATLNGDAEGQRALGLLCERYERPVRAFIQARVKNPDLAKDLAQGFWLFLLERRTWRLADANRGRFRNFLIGVLRNYLNDDLRRQSTQRRGGGDTPAHLADFELLDENDSHAASLYDREWARCILDRALVDLEAWYKKQGREAFYGAVRRFLPGVQEVPNAATAAAALGVSVEVLRVEIHRARNRLLGNLRQQIGQTVEPADIDNELKHLAVAIAQS
jgi:RNA polymerase sigma-70 factor (ECF subfamily)